MSALFVTICVQNLVLDKFACSIGLHTVMSDVGEQTSVDVNLNEEQNLLCL